MKNNQLKNSYFSWYLGNTSSEAINSNVFLILDPQQHKIQPPATQTHIIKTQDNIGNCSVPSCTPLFTHDCMARHDSNITIKFVNDTTVVGLITDNDETVCREVRDLAGWCQANNLSLNVIKTKGDDCGLQEKEDQHSPVLIDWAVVEQIESFKFLGVHINNLSWSKHTKTVVK